MASSIEAVELTQRYLPELELPAELDVGSDPGHALDAVQAILDGLTWLGIGIIVSSGLYIIHRERRLAKAARLADLATVSASEAPL